ncbi:MAG: hypothetical protein B6247_31055 [Candidatus Parabeggiatoa sp. nov. 2]|nr:MAG: hypothetical protein B6247_31055 [Beggiatoa sp. 4572_84]
MERGVYYFVAKHRMTVKIKFLVQADTYDDLMVLPVIILIPIFSKTITKIRGFMRVAFLTINT